MLSLYIDVTNSLVALLTNEGTRLPSEDIRGKKYEPIRLVIPKEEIARFFLILVRDAV